MKLGKKQIKVINVKTIVLGNLRWENMGNRFFHIFCAMCGLRKCERYETNRVESPHVILRTSFIYTIIFFCHIKNN